MKDWNDVLTVDWVAIHVGSAEVRLGVLGSLPHWEYTLYLDGKRSAVDDDLFEAATFAEAINHAMTRAAEWATREVQS